MKQIIFATGNENKLTEIREILPESDYEITSMKQAGMDFEILEDGKTFQENAAIKAEAVRDYIHAALKEEAPENVHILLPAGSRIPVLTKEGGEKYRDAVVLADDSGLVIDALNGEPGIYSARYLGHDTSYTNKNQDLLRRLEGVPDEKRTARFVCAVAAAFPDGRTEIRDAAMEGRIAHAPAGANGFGYDPIFFLPQYGKTSAEISPEEKNAISHRGKALRAIREVL